MDRSHEIFQRIKEEDIVRNAGITINRNKAGGKFRKDGMDDFAFESSWKRVADIPKAYKRAAAKEAKEAMKTNFAWHPEFGYLSPDPNSCGTLVKIHGEFHLIGTQLLSELEETQSGLAAMRIAFLSITDEGFKSNGYIYHIRNTGMQGITEEALVHKIRFIFSEIVRQEINARQRLILQYPRILGDALSRASATLTSARLLMPFEIIHLISPILLGSTLGLVDGISKDNLIALIDNFRDQAIEEPETNEEDRAIAIRAANLADDINKFFKRLHFTKLARTLFL